MGVVESRREIGADARNIGLRLGNETVKKEPRHVVRATSLVAVKENSPKTIPCSSSDFREPKTYTDKDLHDWNVINVANFSKISANSKMVYGSMADYAEFEKSVSATE